MGGLSFVLAGALAGFQPANVDPVDMWRQEISEASRRFGVPEPWIRSVMRAESGGRPWRNGRPIVSRAGAMGLMQLMPGTWASLRVQLDLGPDPYAPRDNILAGTAYLRAMFDRFGYPGMFAAYNAGPGRYARHLATGRPLPRETVNYVAAVTARQERSERRVQITPDIETPSPIFATSGATPGQGPSPADRNGPLQPSLFAFRRPG